MKYRFYTAVSKARRCLLRALSLHSLVARKIYPTNNSKLRPGAFFSSGLSIALACRTVSNDVWAGNSPALVSSSLRQAGVLYRLLIVLYNYHLFRVMYEPPFRDVFFCAWWHWKCMCIYHVSGPCSSGETNFCLTGHYHHWPPGQWPHLYTYRGSTCITWLRNLRNY